MQLRPARRLLSVLLSSDYHLAGSSNGNRELFQKILRQGIITLCSLQLHDPFPRNLVTVLLRCSWASVRLLDPSSGCWREGNHAYVTELSQCLCSLFVILGDSADELQGDDVIFLTISHCAYRPSSSMHDN